MDPLSGSTWSQPETVAGFERSLPNAVLMRFAAEELRRASSARAIDVGCGAGRNALPLARLGFEVVAADLSWPMIVAAARRAREDGLEERIALALAPMDALPVRDASFDLVVAHGIWNLAGSGAEFRRAVVEAARVAKPGAGLFVFTFSRNTLAADAEPLPGESFVFTHFAGVPQCFLTEEQLAAELAAAGFARDGSVPLTEYNRRPPGSPPVAGPPVIYEAAFRRLGR